MKSIQGASFYDSLAMVATGALLCYTANDIWFEAGWPQLFSNNYYSWGDAFSVTLFLTVSFFVGLFLNKVLEWLFGKIAKCCGLFNVTKKMKKEFSDFLKKPNLIEKTQSYAIFLLSENETIISIKEIADSDKDEEVRAAYNWCYFNAEKNQLLTNVHILEAQVAFLRNILPVGILMIGYYAHTIYTVVALLILAFVVTDLWLWNTILKKQLYLVWEAGLYDVKCNENTNN